MRILVFLTVSFFIGCSSSLDEVNTSSPSNGNGNLPSNFVASDNLEVSAEVKNLYPNVAFQNLSDICDTSQTDSLVGCYVSETCGMSDQEHSWLYVTSFSNDGLIRSKRLWFLDDPNCSSGYLLVGLSALEMSYSLGNEITSSLGLEVGTIDSELHVNAGAFGAFVTKYVSSYHLENGRLCFPEYDYRWDEGDGGLFFNIEEGEDRPTDINFSDCLIRLN